MTGGKRVAIIDDDPLVRSSAASLLRSYGVVPETFESAENFLKSDLLSFDCLISDVQMGEMSGLALLERLRSLDIQLPVILVTAYANEKIEGRAQAAGVEAFLEKPWNIDDLVTSLERVLGPLD
ncbi:hypothetical protein L284_03445 [Novosphingobium lindaniclasticum LE124]|uniref:Response regulatory domain-containing protein n=2 Tax=Novosphingobium TaxID=165696 RepID=T0I0S1_9SPHN|nr:hypothetical protein L284_03445 [Novosphingobium lindaniclasticum LE124]